MLMRPLPPVIGCIRHCDFCHCSEIEDLISISGEHQMRVMFLLPDGAIICWNCAVLGEHEQRAA